MARTPQDLVNHLNKYKDAVIIIGDAVVKDLNLFKVDETTKDVYNRKTMVKEPDKFWKYYKENIFKGRLENTKEQDAINNLLVTDIANKVIVLSQEGYFEDLAMPYDVISLKGNQRFTTCVKCNSIQCLSHKFEPETKCKCCGGRIKPTVLMYGEDYGHAEYTAAKNAVFNETEEGTKLNTHTLIFIGVDFEEDIMHEFIENFDVIKKKYPEEPHYSVIIADNDTVSIGLYEPEFATDGDIAGSVERLITLIKEV
jgi:hypothetical protein